VARTPTRIGRYDLITALAVGGMGRIFLGRTTGLGGFERKVVVKTLELPVSEDLAPAIAMFLDEARLLGLLHHQHIASVFEVGRDDDGRHYIVLDYVEGYSAHDVWERANEYGAALPLDFSLTVVSAIANALHYTHTRKDPSGNLLGIVHRDVTPSNVMIGYDGAIKLIDFGIAMAADRKTKTQTGFVKGKVGYLSPEQVAGRDVDARTDVFALGILLYELTTLQRAFRDSSDLATMQRIKAGKVVRPSRLVGDYPPELERIVLKALQVDPRERFADADAMRRAIEALGHQLRFVLGDAAVIEVMSQLFEPSAPGASARPPSRMSDPAMEWTESDHDLTVRRDPEELLALMRAAAASPAPAGEPEPPVSPGPRPRKLRAATEVADALIVHSVDSAAGSQALAAASASPPNVFSALPTDEGLRDPAFSVAFSAVTPATTPAAARPAPSASSPMVGAGLVQAHGKRSRPLRWIGAFAVVGGLVAAGYLVTRGPTGAATGSPAPTPTVAAHLAPPPDAAPPPPPPPDAAPPPAPRVRVRIVTHPGDATVLLDGKKLGHTPLDESIPADPGKHVLKLRHRGYVTHLLDVDLGADLKHEVTLTPQK